MPAWLLCLVVGVVATITHLIVSEAAQKLIYPAITLGTAVAIFAGLRLHRPSRPASWYLLGLTLLMWFIGDLILRMVKTTPSPADAFYVLAYMLLIGSLALLVRSRTPGHDRASLIEASIVCVIVGILAWVFLMAPFGRTAALSNPQVLVSMAYPMLDVFLVTIAVRLAISPGKRSSSMYLLGLGLLALLIGDVIRSVNILNGTLVPTLPNLTSWLLNCVFVATAALHPSMRGLTERADSSDKKLSMSRLSLITAGSLVAPTAFAIESLRGRPVNMPLIISGSLILSLLVICRVATDRTDSSLAKEREFLKAMLQNIADGILACDASGDITVSNRATQELYGLPTDGLPVEQSCEHYGLYLADGVTPMQSSELPMLRALQHGPVKDVEIVIVPKNGVRRRVLAAGQAIFVRGEKIGAVMTMSDVTQRRRAEEALAHQALHDALTGLPNRALFLDRVEHALNRDQRTGEHASVIFLDLDDFKTINDALGHAAGDEALVAVARRLLACMRTTDTAARLGGDEFAILLEDLPGPAEVFEIVARILQALGEPLTLEASVVSISTSVGIVVSNGTEANAGELLRNADLAMYKAKGAGKGRYEIFEAGMHAAVVERLELKADMERGMEGGEFVPHYQPIIDLDSGRIVALEALVRWQHPHRGLIAPAEFIDLAEETGLIIPMGRAVLRQACREVQSLQDRYGCDSPLKLSVNLSARQLRDPGLVDDVADALREAELTAEQLTLEITESILMADTEGAAATLSALKLLGVKLALDDFGTGYSSLSYLQRFPVDMLKIDKSFVDGLGSRGADESLVLAIVGLGQMLGLAITAEGIEVDGQLARLKELRCKFGQGYYFSKPVTGRQMAQLLASDRETGHAAPGLSGVLLPAT